MKYSTDTQPICPNCKANNYQSYCMETQSTEALRNAMPKCFDCYACGKKLFVFRSFTMNEQGRLEAPVYKTELAL